MTDCVQGHCWHLDYINPLKGRGPLSPQELINRCCKCKQIKNEE